MSKSITLKTDFATKSVYNGQQGNFERKLLNKVIKTVVKILFL